MIEQRFSLHEAVVQRLDAYAGAHELTLDQVAEEAFEQFFGLGNRNLKVAPSNLPVLEDAREQARLIVEQATDRANAMMLQCHAAINQQLEQACWQIQAARSAQVEPPPEPAESPRWGELCSTWPSANKVQQVGMLLNSKPKLPCCPDQAAFWRLVAASDDPYILQLMTPEQLRTLAHEEQVAWHILKVCQRHCESEDIAPLYVTLVQALPFIWMAEPLRQQVQQMLGTSEGSVAVAQNLISALTALQVLSPNPEQLKWIEQFQSYPNPAVAQSATGWLSYLRTPVEQRELVRRNLRGLLKRIWANPARLGDQTRWAQSNDRLAGL